MKDLNLEKLNLPGKALLLLFMFLSFFLTTEAQTNQCKADFDFKIDQTSNTVHFVARSNSSTARYAWTMGDGSRKTGQQIRHTYASKGSYKVCLKVFINDTVWHYDSINRIRRHTLRKCTTDVCKEIVLKRCADFKADFEFDVDGKTVKVKGRSNRNTVVYGFSFGDSTLKRGNPQRHTYDKRGIYQVCMIAKDTANDCVVRICKRVEIGKKDCQLKADYDFRIKGRKAYFKARANEKGLHYFWTFGDGKDGKGKEIRHKYKKPGVYQVCLIVFNPKTKCKVCVCKKVIIVKKCNLKGKIKTRQHVNQFVFKARTNASKQSRYLWDFGDGKTATGKKVRHTYTKRGVYNVTLIIVDKRRECRIKVSDKVYVGVRPKRFAADDNVGQSATKPSSSQPKLLSNDNFEVKVYPLPASNTIAVTVDTKEITKLVIHASDGQALKQVDNDFNNIDIRELPKGMYFIHVYAKDGSITATRFIKES